MKFKKLISKKGFKKAVTAVLTLTMLFSSVVSVFAAGEGISDPAIDRSITIHKYRMDDITEARVRCDGTVQTVPSTAVALQDVQFKITKMQDSDVTKQDTSWTPVTLTTNAQGTATITGNSKLPMGIYLVQEIDNPAVDIKAADCLVSLPLTNPAGDGWIYDVHIYPKNQLKPGPEIDKFITQLDNKDDTCDISQENKWIIETTMPDDMATCDVYQITDVLDTRLDFVSGSTELYRVDIHGNRVKMSTGGYTVNEPTTANGRKLTVTLNDTGKKEAAQSLQDIKKPSVYSLGQDNNVGTINIEFRTVLNKTAEGSMGQAIYNGASLDYTNNLHVKYDQVSVPDDKKPETHTTGINLVKVDSTNRNIALPGAKFKIYRSESDANKGINAIVDPTDHAKDWEVTTDAQGKAHFYGIEYGVMGDKHNSLDAVTWYWLVETQAPQNVNGVDYQLSKKPFKVRADSVSYLAANTVTITNVPKYDLPFTGADGGTTFIIGAGFCLIAAGALIVIRIKKSKKAE